MPIKSSPLLFPPNSHACAVCPTETPTGPSRTNVIPSMLPWIFCTRLNTSQDSVNSTLQAPWPTPRSAAHTGQQEATFRIFRSLLCGISALGTRSTHQKWEHSVLKPARLPTLQLSLALGGRADGPPRACAALPRAQDGTPGPHHTASSEAAHSAGSSIPT